MQVMVLQSGIGKEKGFWFLMHPRRLFLRLSYQCCKQVWQKEVVFIVGEFINVVVPTIVRTSMEDIVLQPRLRENILELGIHITKRQSQDNQDANARGEIKESLWKTYKYSVLRNYESPSIIHWYMTLRWRSKKTPHAASIRKDFTSSLK